MLRAAVRAGCGVGSAADQPAEDEVAVGRRGRRSATRRRVGGRPAVGRLGGDRAPAGEFGGVVVEAEQGGQADPDFDPGSWSLPRTGGCRAVSVPGGRRACGPVLVGSACLAGGSPAEARPVSDGRRDLGGPRSWSPSALSRPTGCAAVPATPAGCARLGGGVGGGWPRRCCGRAAVGPVLVRSPVRAARCGCVRLGRCLTRAVFGWGRGRAGPVTGGCGPGVVFALRAGASRLGSAAARPWSSAVGVGVGEHGGDDLVGGESGVAAVQQPDEQVGPQLGFGVRVTGGADRGGQVFESFGRGGGLGGVQTVTGQHRGAVFGQITPTPRVRARAFS